MTKIKYKVWQIYNSNKYEEMFFVIVDISNDRKDISYKRIDMTWESFLKLCTTRLSTFCKRLVRNEMVLYNK